MTRETFFKASDLHHAIIGIETTIKKLEELKVNEYSIVSLPILEQELYKAKMMQYLKSRKKKLELEFSKLK